MAEAKPTQEQLKQELAAPTTTGVRSAWMPATGDLTPDLMATILTNADQGDVIDYLTLAEEMEERDLHYHSVLSTRKNAVSGLPVVVEAATDEDRDVQIADFVRDVVDGDAFAPLLSDLMDAVGKGFSVCEIMWDRSDRYWVPKEFKHRDPRFFQFDRETLSELRLRDAKDMANGLPLQPYKFIQHRPRIKTGLPIRGGLARLVAISYMCKSYGLKDWLAFAEVFGMPIRVGKFPAGATENQKAALLRAVSMIGTDAACIIPEGMMIEFVEAAKTAGGDKLFEGLANWLDHQVSKGVLGQTMTTDDGSSLAQAQVHDRVRGDIRDADAGQLSATLRRDFVKPLIDLNFGVQKKYPKLALVIEQPQDLVALSQALPPFIDRGLRVEASVIRDKFNLPDPEEGAELLQPEAKAAAPAPRAVPPFQPFAPTAMPEPDEMPMAAEAQDEEDEVDANAAKTRPTMMARAEVKRDAIDDLTDKAVEGWRPMMDPILEPLLEHAKACTSYEQFLEGLDGVLAKMDATEFAKRLATATLIARGLGDATDKLP